jgi:hypothetical protein
VEAVAGIDEAGEVMTESAKATGRPLDYEYVAAANAAAMKALADVERRRKWPDSKFGSPVAVSVLCAEIARARLAIDTVTAERDALAARVKELEAERSQLIDELSYSDLRASGGIVGAP